MATKVARSWLDQIEVSAPCPTSWEGMEGDGCVRFCGLCKLNVYNLSGMTQADAETLVKATEGERLCVRFVRRADGKVLTQDCPVGLAGRVKRRTLAAAAWFLAFFGVGSIAGIYYRVQTQPRNMVVGQLVMPSPRVQPSGNGG